MYIDEILDILCKNNTIEETKNIIYKEQNKKTRKYKIRKWGKLIILKDNALMFKGEYRKHSFCVVIPNKINDLFEQMILLQYYTWGYANEFYNRYVVPYFSEIYTKLNENGNVVIRFTSRSNRVKPVIYSEFDKSEFINEVEDIKNECRV